MATKEPSRAGSVGRPKSYEDISKQGSRIERAIIERGYAQGQSEGRIMSALNRVRSIKSTYLTNISEALNNSRFGVTASQYRTKVSPSVYRRRRNSYTML